MNYNFIFINGKKLEDLWKYKRPEYLTKGQMQFIFAEIDRQKSGEGIYLDYDSKYAHSRAPWDIYWDNRHFPGTPVSPPKDAKIEYPEDVNYLEDW